MAKLRMLTSLEWLEQELDFKIKMFGPRLQSPLSFVEFLVDFCDHGKQSELYHGKNSQISFFTRFFFITGEIHRKKKRSLRKFIIGKSESFIY